MFGRIRPEFQCLEGEGQNSSVWKDRARIPMKGQKSNIWKDKKRIAMLGR